MKPSKLINLLIVISSLFGFLHWGGGNSMFLFQAEVDVFTKLLTNPMDVIHPLTILPLVGQILLLVTLFQQSPGKILTWIGIILLSTLLGLMLVIGLMERDWRIILSVVPFFILVFFAIKNMRKPTSHQ